LLSPSTRGTFPGHSSLMSMHTDRMFSLPGPRSRFTMADKTRFKLPVQEFEQRIESGKAAVIGALSGSVAAAPLTFVVDLGSIPQWEFDTDGLALSCALFSVVYRYATREDANEQLRQGVVGGFAITHALAGVKVSDTCVPVPLRCEPYGLYLDGAMLSQGVIGLVVGAVAFGSSAFALEFAISKGWLKSFPSVAP